MQKSFIDGFIKQSGLTSMAIRYGLKAGAKLLSKGVPAAGKAALNFGKGVFKAKSAVGLAAKAGKAVNWATLSPSGMATTSMVGVGVSSLAKKRPGLVRQALRRY